MLIVSKSTRRTDPMPLRTRDSRHMPPTAPKPTTATFLVCSASMAPSPSRRVIRKNCSFCIVVPYQSLPVLVHDSPDKGILVFKDLAVGQHICFVVGLYSEI